jgi:putative intracellular protease/amidase
MERTKVAVLLFNEFETLDAYGPVEIFGRLVDLYEVKFYSLLGGLITNKHGVVTMTEKLSDLRYAGVFLIPGGYGTREEVKNQALLDLMVETCGKSEFVLTVCTGSGLLAKTGLLDGRRATSNRRAFEWVVTNSDKVLWDNKIRWTIDGKYYTSAGVSAGMDMTLGFLADRHGRDLAKRVASEIEYRWDEDLYSEF